MMGERPVEHVGHVNDFNSWVQVYEDWRLTLDAGDSSDELKKGDMASDASASTTGELFSRLTSGSEDFYMAEGDELFAIQAMEEGGRLCRDAAVPESATEDAIEGLAVGHALALQRELLEAFCAPDFQSELLHLLRERGGPDAMENLAGREELCLSAAREALAARGFECSAAGLAGAFKAIEAFAVKSQELQQGAVAVYDSLGLVSRKASEDSTLVPWAV
uniref:Uncharacterized protein n=1 Tax=Alexandrium catenella TaxID=2925 RepID=A0A7S1L533_ALECA